MHGYRRSLYRIGIRALLAGTTYLDSDPLLKVIRPHLALLGKQVRGTVNYGRLDGRHIVYLASWEAPGRERATARVGRRLPAHATALGQAVLASLEPAEAAQHLAPELAALTPDTITSRTVLAKELAAVRRRGYALERGQDRGHRLPGGGRPGPGRRPGRIVRLAAVAELTKRSGSARLPMP